MNKILKRVLKRVLVAFVLLFALFLLAFFIIVPTLVEDRMNAVLDRSSYKPSPKAAKLHKKLLIVDLHADSLLWGRNLLERGTRGHVDIPRLIEGNVAVQAFTVVTKTPRGQNIESTGDSTDNITLLAIAGRWPIATWSSLKERAFYQAGKLHEIASSSNGKLVIIKTSSDLKSYLERRKRDSSITAGYLGLEGAHALEGDPANVDAFFNAGFRMMAPTHFFDNEMGGSAHGVNKGGLTDKGREMIKRMEEKRIIVDLAHASLKTIDDVLAMATRPVVVSHTGVKATCDNARNLSDDQIKAIAKTGGAIGIGYWDTAVCGTDVRAIILAIRHVVDLVGADYVALGSDYDGAIPAPFDTANLIRITDALIVGGFSDEEIEKIMGGNVIRLLKENLP